MLKLSVAFHSNEQKNEYTYERNHRLIHSKRVSVKKLRTRFYKKHVDNKLDVGNFN